MVGFLIDVLKSFVALFIVLDPFLGLAIFIHLTKSMSTQETAEQASIAMFVAFALLMIFLFSGAIILKLLGITLASFIVAGGLILLILGIQAVLGIEFQKKHKTPKAAAVIIGTPLLCGPGTMTTVIILSDQYGYLIPFIGGVLAMSVTWLMLFYARSIHSALGERVVEVLSRVLGLVLAAMAAEFIRRGVTSMITGISL